MIVEGCERAAKRVEGLNPRNKETVHPSSVQYSHSMFILDYTRVDNGLSINLIRQCWLIGSTVQG